MKPKRRILYIKKDFQFKFIMKFCVIVILGSILSTIVLYYLSQDSITSTFHNSRLALRTTSQVILPAIMYTNLFVLFMVGLGVTFVTLYISHKIAGPIYRIEQDIKQIASGDLTRRIRLRSEDQLKDLANAFNELLGSLDHKMGGMNERIDKMILEAPENCTTEDYVHAMRELQKALKEEFKATDAKNSD